MKKAAIYMRVSTQNQEEEQTIENQKMELLKRVEDDGNLLLSDCIYEDDGWSGSIIERPALDQMRTDARDKKFEVLYVYDRGRLSRKQVHQEIILEELRELKIQFIGLCDINGEDDMSRVMGSVMGLFHEYERLKIAERLRLGKIRKVRENGKLLGYQPKYGYDYLSRIKKGENARDGHFVVNEKQAKVVRQIYEWAASGMSKYAIREELAKLSILPPKAKRNQWSLGTIDRMLQDTTYKGEHYYNKSESVPTKNPIKKVKYRRTVKGSRIARPKEEWMKVEVDPIVSPELFNKVQIQLARNKRTYIRNSKHSYLLGGLIDCSCGYSRAGELGQFYRCSDRVNSTKGTRKCFEKSVNSIVLDSLVWKNVEELLIKPELVIAQAQRWQQSDSPLDNQLSALKQRLGELDKVEERYAKAYGEGVMSEHIYKNNMYELNEGRAKLAAEVAALEDERANKPMVPLEKLVDGVIKLVGSLDFTDKKQIIQKLVTKVVATKKEVTVWGRLPLLTTEQVGLNAKYRYCWVAQCWQVYPV